MKKITGILFSMELTGILLLLFTISIGYATFIENDFGTLTAKDWVSNAKWFESMLLLLAINMAGSIVKRKMYLRAKWPILLFHVSFIVILLGAATTRYIGDEGMMAIREGSTSSEMRSSDTFIRIWADDGQSQAYEEEKVFATAGEVSGFSESMSLNSHDVSVEVLEYFVNATEEYVEEEGGEELLWIVYANELSGRQEIFLGKGEVMTVGGFTFAFDSKFDGNGLNIFWQDEVLVFVANDTIQHMDMVTNEGLIVEPNTSYPFEAMNLYSSNKETIVLKQYIESSVKKLVSSEGQNGGFAMDAFKAKVTVDGNSKVVNVFGGNGVLSMNSEIEMNGVVVTINYGVKVSKLPFSIKLNDFVLDRYPGSNSPASYASEVTIIDEENSLMMPYRIYMNNILNYGGYRFFQSSYDKDELGTVLSVSQDTAGTVITYIGYFIMTLGMILTIFTRKSRFRALLKRTSKVRLERKNIASIIFIAFMIGGLSGNALAQDEASTDIPVIDKEHAAAFGKLQVLGNNARLRPINTLASEVLRKIARKNSFQGMSPTQVYLGIMAFPHVWNDIPMIKVTHPQLKSFLGIEGKYAAFTDIVDMQSGEYKLKEYVELAYAKKPALQNKFDKDIIQVDERINVYYMIYSGSFLSIFPLQGDKDNKWTTAERSPDIFNAEDNTMVKNVLSNYLSEVIGASQSDDWSKANEELAAIYTYQKEYGNTIYLSDSKVSTEIFYNKFNIFKRLSMYYFLIGFILLILHFINVLRPKINLNLVIKIGSFLIFLLFLLHTAGLALRWYISGHAPWSDGYESMIYIAWATALSGLIFVWRSGITLSVTALLASLILAVAGMNWMDPEITNLVPVLKSYWLIIHVAVITASYGFLGLGALLGFLNLVFMIIKSKKNRVRVNLTIKELKYIIEVSLIIGLFLLTIGTFLGGVWANESWGRYWGWDPKETWALATVVFYSFVVHMRFIPGLRGNFAFSFTSIISYGFVMMTYFGVNYYLSGLHSYASGDPVPVPNFVYYTLLIIAVVSVWAFFKDRKYSEEK